MLKHAHIGSLASLSAAIHLASLATIPAQPIYYANPVLAGDYPDPSVIRVGDDYWATTTSSEWAPHFPLLHSKDLVNWEIKGHVFQDKPEWADRNFWASEISEHGGRFYIYYTARKKGGPLHLAVATAGHPGGPYTDHGPLIGQPMGSIDAFPTVDENGRRYLIWKEDGNSQRRPTILYAQPLSEDGTRLEGEMQEIMRNEAPWEGAVIEGPCIVRKDGWFYLFYAGNACCGSGCNYAEGVARSRSLLGPYEKNPANPILAANEAWRCPGHGTVVQDHKGRYHLLYHAYEARNFVFTGRMALLDEIVFGEDGWPTINAGQGPSQRAPSPHGQPESNSEHVFSDDFQTKTLQPGWQWPHWRKPTVQLNPARQGTLRLRPAANAINDPVGGMLARSTTTGNYVATAVLNRRGLQGDGQGGLAAVGDPDNCLGVSIQGNQALLWRRQGGMLSILANRELPTSELIHLQLLSEKGSTYRFAFSVDGVTWTAFAEPVTGDYLPPWDRAVRVALTSGGHELGAVFESFNMRPER